jgi:hypothetical protein
MAVPAYTRTVREDEFFAKPSKAVFGINPLLG